MKQFAKMGEKGFRRGGMPFFIEMIAQSINKWKHQIQAQISNKFNPQYSKQNRLVI
jgi:hypothetical protein